MGGDVIVAVEGGLVDDHVDNDRDVGDIASSAVGTSTRAAHLIETTGQRADGIGTALGLGTWICRAYGVGQKIQALVEGHGVGGLQGAPDLGGRLPIAERADFDMPALDGGSVAAYGIPIEAKYQRIECHGDALMGPACPARQGLHDGGIQLGHHRVVVDEFGAVDDQCDSPIVKIAGGEAFSDCAETVPQNLGVAHLTRGQRLCDALRRSDFSGNPIPAIQRVPVTLVRFVQVCVPVDEHTDRVQSPGTRLRLGTLCRRDHIDQICVRQ